ETEFALPSSLKIVAALNSTDRSVAPLDAALRRRFSIINVGPDYSELARHFGLAKWTENAVFTPPSQEPSDWSAADVKELALHVLRSMNERIELVLGQDFLLGHGLLWNVEGIALEDSARSLAGTFDERIVSTLRLTFVDQDETLAAILNIGPPPSNGMQSVQAGLVARWK